MITDNSFCKKKTKIRALGLLSGGLDSTLAAKLILEQGIEVYAINFTSPFCTCTPKKAGCAAVITAVIRLGGIPLKRFHLGDDYLEIVRNPQHGYGSGLNPCIDCRIFKVRKALDYMRVIGASFLFTGEVIGQRPMSQHKTTLSLIDRVSELKGYILRPLSAKYMDPTVPEKKGWIDRNKLQGITGRSRKAQIALAAQKDIRDYPCPAGGCLLTDKNFSERMRDYFTFTEKPSIKDIPLLKIGRHFRLDNGDKVIVARNEDDGKSLKNMCSEKDHFMAPMDFRGPAVVLKGNSFKAALDKMMQYTKQAVPNPARITHLHRGKTDIMYLEN